jgi:hypothetical protein
LKKLSVIMLALAMTLSMAVVASAAEFSPYIGGEFQLTYWGAKEDKDAPLFTQRKEGDGDWARYKVMLTGTVEDEETGTWAKIGAKLTTWNHVVDDKGVVAHRIYEAGIKGIGGILDIWYTNDENNNFKRGQIPIWKVGGAKFGGDPMMGAWIGGINPAPGDILGFDFNFDNAALNLGYRLNKGSKDADNEIRAAGTYNFDAGSAHFSFGNNEGGDTIVVVGGNYGLGFGTIEADVVQVSPDKGDSSMALQVAASIDDFGLKQTLVYDDKIYFNRKGGYGVALEYTGFGDFVLGAKMLTASKKVDEGNNVTDFYVGYNYGVFETRLGSY